MPYDNCKMLLIFSPAIHPLSHLLHFSYLVSPYPFSIDGLVEHIFS